MKKRKINCLSLSLLLLAGFMLLAGQSEALAQGGQLPFRTSTDLTLSRGKMWETTKEWGLISHFGELHHNASYPGHRGNRNDKNVFVSHRPWTYYMGCKADCVMQRQRIHGYERTYLPYGEHEVIKNYNFEIDPTMPEEYKVGNAITPELVPQDGGIPNLLLDIRCEKYVWSLPKYDDFVITRTRIINIDQETLTKVRIGWYHNMTPSRGGSRLKGFDDDTEYVWYDDLPMGLDPGEGTFVFFDDTEIPQFTGIPTTYGIEPGVTHGDRGDPGNIKTVGSIDAQLYSPQVVAFAIIDATPDKNGEKKGLYNIISAQNDAVDWSFKGGGVPGEEFFRYDTGADFGLYDEHRGYIGDKDNAQIRRSWKENNANPDPNKPTDGSFFERVPTLFVTAGPWDLAVGDSAEVWHLIIGGDADRSITMKGGLSAVAILPDASLENFRENWQAAWDLYSAAKANGFTNWNEAIDAFPPPTVGNVPEMSLGDELIVDTYSEVVDGESDQGYLVKWLPVPDSYVDPKTGVNDFKEYIVYKSVIGIEGSWDEVARIAKGSETIEDGRAVFKVSSAPGIPTRWGVTTIDTDGNESAMSAHTFFPVTASPPPIDDLTTNTVRVMPNPFRQFSGLLDPAEQKRLTFVNIPAQCTIRIYTMAGDLVKVINHDGFGATSWGTNIGNNYQLTDFGHNVMPGIYIYHIANLVPGHEGETIIGKFAIIR